MTQKEIDNLQIGDKVYGVLKTDFDGWSSLLKGRCPSDLYYKGNYINGKVVGIRDEDTYKCINILINNSTYGFCSRSLLTCNDFYVEKYSHKIERFLQKLEKL